MRLTDRLTRVTMMRIDTEGQGDGLEAAAAATAAGDGGDASDYDFSLGGRLLQDDAPAPAVKSARCRRMPKRSAPVSRRAAKKNYPFRCLVSHQIVWEKRHVVRRALPPTLSCSALPSHPERCRE
eukprot:COSAG01_NODE_231_length_21019_cov_104.980501_9_plen_125_part_00